jgi:transposase
MMIRAVVDGGLSKAAAAREFNTTPKTVAKWIVRFEAGGWTVVNKFFMLISTEN